MTTEPLHALRGLHAPADPVVNEPPWWPFHDGRAYAAIDESRTQAVLVWSSTPAPVLAELRRRGLFVVARTHVNHTLPAEQQFDILADHCRPLLANGVTWMQVWNEPNLKAEGYGTGWSTPAECAALLRDVTKRLREAFPAMQLGFPPMSNPPGGMPPALGTDGGVMLDGMAAAGGLEYCQWIAVHDYFTGAGTLAFLPAFVRVMYTCLRWRDYPVMWTEFANTSPIHEVSYRDKGEQYATLYQWAARFMPGNLMALMSFALSATAGWPEQMWLPDGTIPRVLGERFTT